MAKYGEQREEPKGEAKHHLGFASDGKAFRSEVPVQNACTGIVGRLVALVVAGDTTPSDLILHLRTKPDWFLKLWSPAVVGSWATLDRMEQWPCAFTEGSIHQVIKHGGRAVPLWLSDENAWSGVCDRWEQAHAQESRYGHTIGRLGVVEVYIGQAAAEAARCALDRAQRGIR
jgi:hypothetical protein